MCKVPNAPRRLLQGSSKCRRMHACETRFLCFHRRLIVITVKGDLTQMAEEELGQLANTELRYLEEFGFPNIKSVSQAAPLPLLVTCLEGPEPSKSLPRQQ